MRSARLVRFTALILLVLVAGCSNNTGPVAGIIDVRLSSPHSDDGAVLLSITGGPVDSVDAAGHKLYSARTNADTLKLIVVGSLGSGPIARIHIPDNRHAFRYVARIGQVAARGTYEQRNPAGYRVALVH